MHYTYYLKKWTEKERKKKKKKKKNFKQKIYGILLDRMKQQSKNALKQINKTIAPVSVKTHQR